MAMSVEVVVGLGCVAVNSCGLAYGIRRVVQGISTFEAILPGQKRVYISHKFCREGCSTALLLSLALTSRPDSWICEII